MLLIDLAGRDPDACAERALERAHIAVNRMAVPSDSPGAMAHSATGLRAGTPAVTTRGFGDAEIRMLSGWVAVVLDAGEADAVVDRVRAGVRELTAEFPVYAQRS
jgi:glycine hydroxymethyltransferase